MGLKEIGTIRMNTNGLRKLANSMDMIYGDKVVIMPVWEDKEKGLLFFQLENNTGEIFLVEK